MGGRFRDRDILLIDLVAASFSPDTSDCNDAGIDEFELIVSWVPDQSFGRIVSGVHGA